MSEKVARAARDTWREAEAIHDKGEFPTKYRAPYAGLVKVNDALASLPPHLAKRIKESGR